MPTNQLAQESIGLLKKMIAIPSFSGKEEELAALIRSFLTEKSIPFYSMLNNTWCFNKYWDESKPVILLDSHIDTVKPVSGWTYDPFRQQLKGIRLRVLEVMMQGHLLCLSLLFLGTITITRTCLSTLFLQLPPKKKAPGATALHC